MALRRSSKGICLDVTGGDVSILKSWTRKVLPILNDGKLKLSETDAKTVSQLKDGLSAHDAAMTQPSQLPSMVRQSNDITLDLTGEQMKSLELFMDHITPEVQMSASLTPQEKERMQLFKNCIVQ